MTDTPHPTGKHSSSTNDGTPPLQREGTPAGQETLVITAKRLDSGYWLIRGDGPCEWAQPPHWPCAEETLRRHAFPEASERFIQAALMSADRPIDPYEGHKSGCEKRAVSADGRETPVLMLANPCTCERA